MAGLVYFVVELANAINPVHYRIVRIVQISGIDIFYIKLYVYMGY